MKGDVEMIAICIHEFKNLFKSIRSVLIILLLLGVTIGTASLLEKFAEEIQEMGLGGIYIAGLYALLMIAGPLFVLGLSHDVINKETHSRTIRFLVTKTSRNQIILGKFLGVLSFWFSCIFISSLLVIPFSGEFYAVELIDLIIFIGYFVALALFLSTAISKPGLTMFIGLLLSIALPVLGIWGILSPENNVLKIISFLTPYYYLGQENTVLTYIMLPVLTVLLVTSSLFMLRRRDL